MLILWVDRNKNSKIKNMEHPNTLEPGQERERTGNISDAEYLADFPHAEVNIDKAEDMAYGSKRAEEKAVSLGKFATVAETGDASGLTRGEKFLAGSKIDEARKAVERSNKAFGPKIDGTQDQKDAQGFRILQSQEKGTAAVEAEAYGNQYEARKARHESNVETLRHAPQALNTLERTYGKDKIKAQYPELYEEEVA